MFFSFWVESRECLEGEEKFCFFESFASEFLTLSTKGDHHSFYLNQEKQSPLAPFYNLQNVDRGVISSRFISEHVFNVKISSLLSKYGCAISSLLHGQFLTLLMLPGPKCKINFPVSTPLFFKMYKDVNSLYVLLNAFFPLLCYLLILQLLIQPKNNPEKQGWGGFLQQPNTLNSKSNTLVLYF